MSTISYDLFEYLPISALEQQIEEGVFRVLRPSSRNLNCVCFVRTISDIDKHLASEHASNFCDVIKQDGNKPVRNEAKKKALKELKQKLKVPVLCKFAFTS